MDQKDRSKPFGLLDYTVNKGIMDKGSIKYYAAFFLKK